jgi:DTW domain-containing protein YfiP
MSTAPRLSCATCTRPQTACICQWITPTAHTVEVVVLQHPLEVDNPKGSARLLCLSLSRSHLVTGEVFDETALHALLTQPLPGQTSSQGIQQSVLLYPETPPGQQTAPPPQLSLAALSDPTQLRLIVLDGTWRKSRKMLFLNPLLQQLPRLPLRDMPASHYLIRKAHRPDQLSTLEATCAALGQLEQSPEAFAPLLAAFDGFVAQQMDYRTQHAALCP